LLNANDKLYLTLDGVVPCAQARGIARNDLQATTTMQDWYKGTI
jgi:hypothetical protein